MQLKAYQDKAVNDLKTKLYALWRNGHKPAWLVFKAPTGAGKTIMAAELLKRVSGDAQFDPDKAYIWISFNPDSVEQSRAKLAQYLHGGIAALYDTDEISARGKLSRNDVLFVNWQKLAANNKETRKLHREGESTITFKQFIANSKKPAIPGERPREIILVVDECHLARSSDLSSEIVKMIDPRLELLISATPRTEQRPTLEEHKAGKADEVQVSHSDVVESGIIKRSIQTMPKEQVKQHIGKGKDIDQTLLDLAIAKRQELAAMYRKAGASVNPLVLIKLPNDEKKNKAAEGQDKLTFTQQYLAKMGIPPERIAIWLTAKKENLASITENESPIEFLIFKQAAATGWDCPRADVLVMYREIHNPVFETQVLGRVLRTAEGKHYGNGSELDDAYLFTSYERKAINEGMRTGLGPNTPQNNIALLREDISNIELPSVYLARAHYNDLGFTFQSTFRTVANKYFGITGAASPAAVRTKLEQKGLQLDATTVTNRLIVNAKIEVFDDYVTDLAAHSSDLDVPASPLDIQKLYTNLLWHELAIQTEDDKKYAPERSWSDLKSALNVYFRDDLKISNPPLYAVICNDLAKEDTSILRPLISEALGAYRPVRNSEVNTKIQSTKQKRNFTLLPSYNFSDDAEILTIGGKEPRAYALTPARVDVASSIERDFMAFLEKNHKNIDWWFKNGDYGRDSLGIPYKDVNGDERVFYPDFIVRQGNTVNIFDTKDGETAKSAKEKAEALQLYIKTAKTKYKLRGGIVINSAGTWMLNASESYAFDERKLSRDWKPLTF